MAEWVIAALGLLGAGAVLVPLNTRFKGPEAAYVLRRSGAKALFTVRGFLGIDYPALLEEEDIPDSGDGSSSSVMTTRAPSPSRPEPTRSPSSAGRNSWPGPKAWSKGRGPWWATGPGSARRWRPGGP
jgi:acyl-CoA synthetase (AMP-forming)/AMP-acid ligase II